MSDTAYARNVTVLATCQALFFMANTIVISTTALVGLELAPTPALSSLALGLQFVGTMAGMLPASFLMQRFGRRAGFLLGGLFGIAAGVLGWDAIMRSSFAAFCLAGLVYGVFGAFCQFYRFAAADAANAATRPGALDAAARRSRAIGWVMAGGTVAALLGPLLARWTQDLFAPVMFAGCFAAIALLGGLICLALGFLDPLRPRRQGSAGSGRPLAAIARQPAAVTAFLTALVAYVTMNLLMTATPLAMLACGFGFAESATVIQWHVLGMFAPSFVTGHLIARFGVMRVIAAGVVLMAACVGVDLLGVEVVHFAAGLLLLGVGWNFMFIGATALLTSCYTEAEKAKVQGLNDFLIFTTVAVSASSAGALHHLLGWQAMNLLAVPGLLLVAAAILFRAGLGTLARREALGG
ncbi:MAG TPA: MFS transporter [Geminicoccaceae bacterium]|nr:MFS transporter [Geminicoccaceae bacterium]